MAVGIPVHAVSALDAETMQELRPHVGPGRTAALIGPSGVGKSTIVNLLAGREAEATGEIRSDGKGRHTTTWRELIALPDGGVLLDTPGLRGLSLWDSEEGIGQTFADIAALTADCRFADCAHTTEPGCAVLLAIDEGRLAADRMVRYRKMQREQARLDARREGRARAEESARGKQFAKQARAHRAQWFR